MGGFFFKQQQKNNPQISPTSLKIAENKSYTEAEIDSIRTKREAIEICQKMRSEIEDLKTQNQNIDFAERFDKLESILNLQTEENKRLNKNISFLTGRVIPC